MNIRLHNVEKFYQDYHDEIDHEIKKVLSSGQYIMGENVFQFENQLSQFLNGSEVISCASGTDALLLSLLAIDIKPGDEVITSPFSFIAAAEVIALLGATPVFVDIDADTYLIDVKKIPAALSQKTRAIIPISLFGQPADMDEIQLIANNHENITIIEDAAQSLGATYKNRYSGNISELACVSFFPTKPLGCFGDGGAVLTSNLKLAGKIRALRVHGQTARYRHAYLGINGRLDTMQAAILHCKLKYFNDELKTRTKIAERYHLLLKNSNLVLPKIKNNRTSTYAQFSLRSHKRASIIEELKSRQIPTAIHYPIPLHLQPCFQYLNYALGDFPVAEQVANEIFSIPMCAYLTEFHQSYICNALIEISEKINSIPYQKLQTE